jgi:ankyrin repeat protein
MLSGADNPLEKKRNRILEWIPSVSFRSDHDDKLSKRLPGTGQWLLEHPFLQAWKTNSNSDILVVEGRSGCGKSCLAAMVIDTLLKESKSSDDKVAVAFVYCSSMDTAKINPTQLQGSLLKQLCIQIPNSGIVQFIETMFDKNAGDTPSPDQLQEAISAVSVGFNQTFIVVDGLDECHRLENDRFDRFCKFLRSLAEAIPSLVKVMIFSRPGYPATDQFFRSYPHVKVDSGANEGDIKKFIKSVVSGEELHIRRNETLLKYVEDELLLKAKGMFLWVGLLVQTLKGARTSNEIKAIMKALPQELPGVYNLSLQRIFDQKSEFSRERALKILLWVTNAKRALSKEELAEALAIEPGMSDLDEGNIIEGDDGITVECGDLIVLRDGNYHLLHSSLQDYLSNMPPGSSDHLNDYRVMQANADRILGEACLTYLQLDKFKTGPLRNKQELECFQRSNPLFKYATCYWGRHVTAASEVGFKDTVRAFVSCDELRELSMQQYHLANSVPYGLAIPYRGSTTPLHILSIFNLARTAESIPDLLQLKHIPDGLYNLPVDYAIWEKCKDMCMWLLQEADDSITRVGPLPILRWPVYIAARNDWEEVIERLISLGYDPEERFGERKKTPLHVAAVHGCVSALNALLKVKVCVDPVDSQNFTPLLDAAESSHQELIPLLLRAGANVNHRGRQELTALHLVAVNGNLTAAMELLQHGSEVDPRAGEWKSLTPLHLAAQNNRREVVRLLLSKGAQIEAKEKFNSTPLLLASSSGSFASLELLISSGASLDARNLEGATALHLAAHKGGLDVCKALLKARDGLINAVDNVGNSPLHRAILANQTQIALFLLKRGASVQKHNNDGYTALHLAILEGNNDLVEHLIVNYKANLTTKSSLGSTALHIAANLGHEWSIKWLIGEDGANANAQNDDLQSVLHLASRRKDFVFIKELARLVPHLDLATHDKWEQSPLHNAASVGATDIVSFLLDERAPSTKDCESNLPLHLAAWNGHLDVVRLLLTKENIDARGFFGRTALFGSASLGDLELVKFLLHSGANPNELDNYNQGPLHAALKNKHLQVAELLLDNKADPKTGDKFGFTPLHEAAQSGNIKLTKKLLEQGCDGFHKSIWGDTPFKCAASSNRVELIDIFLEHHYNGSNITDNAGNTGYHVAAEKGNVEMFEKLTETGKAVGADPGATNAVGHTAMYLAAIGGDVEVLDRLVELGMSVNGSGQAIRSPILEAANRGNVDFVSRLLELKADVEMFCSVDKRTPLIEAAVYRRSKIFRILLSSGANPLQRDVYGLNALDYASRTPEIWETQGEARKNYKPLNPYTRKMMLQDAIRARISSLLKPSPQSTPAEEYERLCHMSTLGYALLALHDDTNHESALVCFSELGNPQEPWNYSVIWQCAICRQKPLIGSKYLCTQCEDIGLCEVCHSDYLQGTEVPKSAPRGLRVLEEMEKDLQPIRNVASGHVLLGASFLEDALDLVIPVKDWIEEKLKALDNWEKEFNSGQHYKAELFPGWKFLKLIEETRQIWKVLQNRNEDVSRARNEDEGEISDARIEGSLEDRADDVSENPPEVDKDSFSAVNESLVRLFEDFRPDREVPPFACSGHDYLEIPSINWAEADTSTGPFDVNGKVTKEWLTDLLARYTNDEVYESQASYTEPSKMEMEELRNLTETLHGENYRPMKVPIRTTTTSELDGVLHSAPQTNLTQVDTASPEIDSSITTKSEDRESSSLETLADDAPIAPVGVSSFKGTLDCSIKAADTSILPEDAKISVPNSDLDIRNGASTNVDERALPGSQGAGSAEQVMANQLRIQVVKEELLSDVASLVQSISTPSVDNSDEKSNKGTRKDSEDDISPLTIAEIIKHYLAFQFVQVILLGAVTEQLFEEDEKSFGTTVSEEGTESTDAG